MVKTNRSNISLPADVASEILAKAQEDSAVMQLARKIDLPGRGTSVPVITGDPAANWVGETDPKPVSDPSLTMKTMTPYKLAVIVPFSNEFRRDAAALYDECVRRLPSALAQKFDNTIFCGTAPGSNFDVFSGCTAQSLTPEAPATVYDALVDMDADVAAHGGHLSGIVISPAAKAILLKATDGTGRPLFVNSVAEGAIPQILGVPTLERKAAYKAGEETDIIGVAGDWSQALYGIVDGVNVSISDQATLDKGNNAIINLFQQNMFAVRAEIELGFVADTSVFNLLTRDIDEDDEGDEGDEGGEG